ncbi:proton-coupled folate transporter-like isoform X2 [Babylonia areolata]
MVPCVAAVAYSVSNILNAVYMEGHLAFTLIGQVFSGLGGSYLAVLMAGYTYLTHLSQAGSRMMRVGVAESAVFLSSTLSVFVSGVLVDQLGYVPTFSIALGCQILAFLYVLFVLPEVKPPGTSASTETAATPSTPNAATTTTTTNTATTATDCVTCRQGACLNPLRDMWRFVSAPRDTRVRVHLALFIVVLDILQLCTTGENDILLLYLKRTPRNWSYTTYGYFKGAENFTRGAAVLLLLPLLKKMASPRDTTLILAGLVSKMAGLVLLGLARETWLVFLVVGVACLQGFPSAGLRSLLASLVHKDEQGRLFGLVASTESVVSLTSTLIFNGIYPETLSLYDGLCFQLAAFFVFICFVIVMFQHRDIKARSGSEDLVPEASSSSSDVPSLPRSPMSSIQPLPPEADFQDGPSPSSHTTADGSPCNSLRTNSVQL